MKFNAYGLRKYNFFCTNGVFDLAGKKVTLSTYLSSFELLPFTYSERNLQMWSIKWATRETSLQYTIWARTKISKYNFLYKKSQRCINTVTAPVFTWFIQSRVHSFRRFINTSGSGTYGVSTRGVLTPVPLPSYIFQAFKCIAQPFELGGETRLIRSTVRWRTSFFFILMIQSHERKIKPYSAA